jgi:hypothetical protein
VEFGDWEVSEDITYPWFMWIKCNGFPTTRLVPKRREMDAIPPPIALNLQKHGFEISIHRKGGNGILLVMYRTEILEQLNKYGV